MAAPIHGQQASLSDILTAAKNLVIAFNSNTQALLQINGTSNYAGIRTATVVKNAPGRIVTVSILIAGSTYGTIYDGAALGATMRPIAPIPNSIGMLSVAISCAYGILVVPGTGQTVSVGYS